MNQKAKIDKEKLPELWASDLTIDAIGKRYGVSGPAVSMAAARLGLPRRHAIERTERAHTCVKRDYEEEFADQWKAGLAVRRIARNFQISPMTAYATAARLGLKTRTQIKAGQAEAPPKPKGPVVTALPQDSAYARASKVTPAPGWTVAMLAELIRTEGRYEAMEAFEAKHGVGHQRALQQWHRVRR